MIIVTSYREGDCVKRRNQVLYVDCHPDEKLEYVHHGERVGQCQSDQGTRQI